MFADEGNIYLVNPAYGLIDLKTTIWVRIKLSKLLVLDGKIKNKSNSTISHCVPIKLNNSEKMISSSQNNLKD